MCPLPCHASFTQTSSLGFRAWAFAAVSARRDTPTYCLGSSGLQKPHLQCGLSCLFQHLEQEQCHCFSQTHLCFCHILLITRHVERIPSQGRLLLSNQSIVLSVYPREAVSMAEQLLREVRGTPKHLGSLHPL